MAGLRHILLVDDDEACLFIAQRILKKLAIDAVILIARNGQEALDILTEACQRVQFPELILLDIKMPVMDGFEFLEHLQNSADLSSASLRIVLLSSSSHDLDLAKTKEYPVIDFIQKPLTPEKLAKYIG